MNEVINTIKERRSVRSYENKDISNTKINKIMDAVRWSPSWANTQCWEIVIIRDLKIKKKLQESLPLKGNPAKKSIIQAPVLFAICAKIKKSGYYNEKEATKFGDWFMYDLGIATQTLCLTAHSMGLSTVIVGLYNHNIAKKIIKIPNKYELVTIIPIGYSAKKSSAPKRREIDEFTHIDFFNL